MPGMNGVGRSGRRAAVVGLNWGVRTHVRCLRERGWFVAALVGRDEARTTAAAFEANIPVALTRLDDLAKMALDLIVVAVPWRLHGGMLKTLLNTSVPLLVEHPLAADPTESLALADAARRRRAPTFVNFPTRFMPTMVELREAICQEGSPSRIVHTVQFPADEEPEWLSLLTSHACDSALQLTGPLSFQSAEVGGARFGSVEQCPSWAWPIRWSEGSSTMLTASRLRLAARSEATLYELTVSQTDTTDFSEVISVEVGHRAFALKLLLHREDERSPWQTSRLWSGRAAEEPHFIMEAAVEDVWLEAHLAQLDAIAAWLDGAQLDPSPALATDASIVHTLISVAVGQVEGAAR